MTGLSGYIGGLAGFGGAALLLIAAVAMPHPARSQTNAGDGQPGVGETAPFGTGATVPSGSQLLRPGVDAQIPTSSSQSGVLQFPVPPVAPVIDLQRGPPQRSAPATPPVVSGQPLPPPGQQTLRQWIDSFNQSALPATPPARTAPARPPVQTQPVFSTARPAQEPVFAEPPPQQPAAPPVTTAAPARPAPAVEPSPAPSRTVASPVPPPPAASAPASPPAQATLASPQPRLTPPAAVPPQQPAAAREALSPPPPPAAAPPAKQAAAPATTAPPPKTAEPAPTTPAAQRAAAPAGAPGDAVDLRIVFPANAIDLPDSFKPQLEELAARMQAEPELRIEMRGYAMAREGGISRARRSSLQRALATRSFLLERQVRSTRMDVRALGDRTPVEPVDRVDIIIKSE